jgi:hypothetical protein
LAGEDARSGFGWLGRSALLILWALVAWGGLLLLLAIGHAFDEGLRPALARLLPAHASSAWGWLNALSAGLALAVGMAAAGLWAWGRLAGSKAETSGGNGAS